ncbi:MAG: hypothetical protein JSS61_01130 [Verrucomicrobia bacterium]|nr:hypothetical protein [Verrucomicrobiota bacterium]
MTKRSPTRSIYKKIQKAIYAAQSLLGLNDQEGDQLTAKEMAKKFPKKPASKAKLAKALAAKKKKGTSKRTTPGTVPSDSTPASIHAEGKRWIKTVVKQNVNQSKSLSRQMAKKR